MHAHTADHSSPDPLRNLGRVVDDCVEIVDAEGRWIMTMPFDDAIDLHRAVEDKASPTAQ